MMATAEPLSDSILISPLTNRPVTESSAVTGEDLKLPSFLCTVCNVKLNTPAQALQHFYGKGHSIGLSKQQAMGANVDQNRKRSRAPRSVPKTSAETAHQSDNELSMVMCNPCGVKFNSPISAQQHYSGKKHAQIMENPQLAATMKRPLHEELPHCNVCNTTLTSQAQYQQHLDGTRHKLKAGIVINEPLDWWKERPTKKSKPQPTTTSSRGNFRCDTCQLPLNSQFQFNEHMQSNKHKECVAERNNGAAPLRNKKPRNPTPTPYLPPPPQPPKYAGGYSFNKSPNTIPIVNNRWPTPF